MGKTTSLMRFWEFLRILPNTFWNSWKNGLNTGSLWLPTQMSALALRAYPCWFEPMKMVCCLRSVSSHLVTQSGSAFDRLTIILLFFSAHHFWSNISIMYLFLPKTCLSYILGFFSFFDFSTTLFCLLKGHFAPMVLWSRFSLYLHLTSPIFFLAFLLNSLSLRN